MESLFRKGLLLGLSWIPRSGLRPELTAEGLMAEGSRTVLRALQRVRMNLARLWRVNDTPL